MHLVGARGVLLMTALLAVGQCRGGAPVESVPADTWVREIRTIRDGGGRLDWNHQTGSIAFDMVGADGYYDVYAMKADGSGMRGLTIDHPDLPRRHIGQPAWHPSGKYLVFQAEKDEHPRTSLKRVVEPGAGAYNDLWLLSMETNRAYPLRIVAAERGNGILHAHFSKDGRQLSWSEMYEAGSLRGKRNLLGHWKLMTADFSIVDGRPQLDQIRSHEPGEPGFYENHGFSPDGKKLLFSSNFEAENRLNSHIYTLELESGRLLRLTDGKEWNEHASYSPDGRHLIWIVRNSDGKGTDYWMMKSDGSDKRRLTYFNQPGHPHEEDDTIVVADLSWGADGESLMAYKRSGSGLENKNSPRSIVLITLDGQKIDAD